MARNSLKSVMRLIDAAKENMSPEQEFLHDLKRSIEMTDMNSRRLPSKTFKPSSMNCIRNSYYQLVGVEPDNTETSYILTGIVHSGSDIHERTQKAVDAMKSNGMDCEYVDVAEFIKQREIQDVEVVEKIGVETKLRQTKYNMSFMCDGIIKYKNRYYILEIKTETSGKWYNRDGVDPGHYNQATAYSLALGIDDIIFLYINRDMLDMKAYLFHVTDDMKMGVIHYIDVCNSYVSKNCIPPKDVDGREVNKKTCEYCSYKQTCRRDA